MHNVLIKNLTYYLVLKIRECFTVSALLLLKPTGVRISILDNIHLSSDKLIAVISWLNPIKLYYTTITMQRLSPVLLFYCAFDKLLLFENLIPTLQRTCLEFVP